MSRERSREVQGTNKHASMLPSRQHIKIIPPRFKTVYILLALVACWGLEVREHWANKRLGQDVKMVLWPLSRWHAPFIRAIPPDFVHKQGDYAACI
jgi:hypothetical protein